MRTWRIKERERDGKETTDEKQQERKDRGEKEKNQVKTERQREEQWEGWRDVLRALWRRCEKIHLSIRAAVSLSATPFLTAHTEATPKYAPQPKSCHFLFPLHYRT